MDNLFTRLFGSPVRKALMKAISNSIKTHEAAFKAEMKTLAEQKFKARQDLMDSFRNDLKKLGITHKTRAEEILGKRVKDILSKVL